MSTTNSSSCVGRSREESLVRIIFCFNWRLSLGYRVCVYPWIQVWRCFVRGVLISPFRSLGPVFCLKGIPSDHFSLRFHLQLCINTYPYSKTRLCTTQYPNDHFLTILTLKSPVFTICKCLALCIPLGCPYGCPF